MLRVLDMKYKIFSTFTLVGAGAATFSRLQLQPKRAVPAPQLRIRGFKKICNMVKSPEKSTILVSSASQMSKISPSNSGLSFPSFNWNSRGLILGGARINFFTFSNPDPDIFLAKSLPYTDKNPTIDQMLYH